MPIALVKFSAVIAKASAAVLVPTMASQVKERLAVACRMPPIHRLVASGNARATKPPAKPPISVAASPTPLTMAAYSLRENPRSMTNGAVMAPANASVNL